MNSGVFLDSQGNYDGRDRHDVLTDFALHEWVKDELGGDYSSSEELVEGLDDSMIYFVEKNYYHTPKNIDVEKAHKVDAGPEGKGKAGDLDIGKIYIPTGKVTKVELKSPGGIPPLDQREEQERTHSAIKHGEEQNAYLKELLGNIEAVEGMEIPYSSRVRAWNDVVSGPFLLEDIPKYSEAGAYLCTPEAESRARNSEKVQVLDEDLFRGWMLGGGESILGDIDSILEE